MTIDQEIYDATIAQIEKDPVTRANHLANSGDLKIVEGWARRQQIAKPAKVAKEEDIHRVEQSETESCKERLDNHHFMWWLTNVLLPLTEMPDDENCVTLPEAIRRKQIEAKAYDKLLNMVYKASKRKVSE